MKKTWFGKQVCLSKDRYKNRSSAELANKVLQNNLGILYEVYKCDYGKHFHLTTKNSPKTCVL